jgi:hypothetical protein
MVVLGFLLFPCAGRDDVYITYWSAYSLSHYGQILNYNGIPFEQSSSLLHVIVLALLHVLTRLDFPILGLLLSLLLGILVIFISQMIAIKINSKISSLVPYLLGSCAYFAYWVFGALESTLASLCILGAIITIDKYYKKDSLSLLSLSSIFLLLLLLVRPEMFIVSLLAILIYLFIRQVQARLEAKKINRQEIRQNMVIFGIVSLWSVIIMTFRCLYFHKLMPQPVYAKSGMINLHSLFRGVMYYGLNMISPPMIIIFALLCYSGYIFIKQLFSRGGGVKASTAILVISYCIAYSIFIVFSGGDWMEGGRFIVPIIPLMILTAAAYADDIKLLANRKVCYGMVVISVLATIFFSTTESRSIYPWQYRRLPAAIINDHSYALIEKLNYKHLRDILTIKPLKKIFDAIYLYKKQKIVILSDQAGMVMYYLGKDSYGRYEFVDLRSLATDNITKLMGNNPLRKGPTGTQTSWQEYFDAFSKRDDYKRPDIVFGTYGETQMRKIDSELAKNRYALLYYYSAISNKPYKSSTQFVAVREELLDKIGLKNHKTGIKVVI